MTCKRRYQGSALLLVVGLLTIIALLGGTFLVVSRFSARSADVAVSKAQGDQLAYGALSRIKALLKHDRRIGPNGPYDGAVGSDYIDAPGVDAWLATESAQSNIFGTGGSLADADGDNNAESYLVDTGVKDPSGDSYYVAARVVDTCSFVNVSIAASPRSTNALGQPQAQPEYVAPVMVDLESYLDSLFPQYYMFINIPRATNPYASPLQIHENLALRVYSPKTMYLPFGISDEMYLRWLEIRAPTAVGRLYKWMMFLDVDPDKRKNLTTVSCMSSLPRQPGNGFNRRLLISQGLNEIEDAGKRQMLYTRLVAAGVPQSEAAHFVANLWAYLTPYNDAVNKSFAFTAPDAAIIAYGLIRQPFITEAYAAFKKSTQDAEPHDHKWFAAVELMNPYQDMDISLVHYTLAGGPLNVNLPARSKVVFYNHNCSDDASVAGAFGINLPKAGWIRVKRDEFTFFNGGYIKLERKAQGAGIAVDSVSSGTLGHSPKDPTDDNEIDDIRRDDDPGRARYSVAVYKHFDDQALGLVNGVGTAHIPSDPADPLSVYCGFALDVRHGMPRSLGDLADIYVVGPDQTGQGLPQKLTDIGIRVSPCRGRANYNRVSAVVAPPYPKLPWPTLLGELLEQIPPDQTRTDTPVAARIYGRINVNTATTQALKLLPWPAYIDLNGNGLRDDGEPAVNTDALAAAIEGGRPYNTPGQVAIALGNYAAGVAGVGETSPYYRYSLDWLYRTVANVVTVNSDTFAAYIRVQLGDPARQVWQYLAVIDRSNCWDANSAPVVLMFTQMPVQKW